MDLLLIVFGSTAGVLIVGFLELIRHFVMSEPQGNRTVGNLCISVNLPRPQRKFQLRPRLLLYSCVLLLLLLLVVVLVL